VNWITTWGGNSSPAEHGRRAHTAGPGFEPALREQRPIGYTKADKRQFGRHDMILQSLAGLPAFLVYICTALVAVVTYLFVYTRVTPHDEFQLIRENDPAAAIALGLSLLGFVLPVVSAIAHSANVWDCLIWSVIALIVQIIVYYIVKIPVPNLSARIAAGELAAAIWLGLASLAAGALNAACMIY
jgi:putative membrane protein